jgi:hypothetical protein
MRRKTGSLGFRVVRFVGAGLCARPRAFFTGDHGGIAPTSTLLLSALVSRAAYAKKCQLGNNNLPQDATEDGGLELLLKRLKGYKKISLVLIGLLVFTWAALGLPGQEAWAVPGQDPGPSIPTLTPTPAEGSQPPGTGEASPDGEAPAPPTILPLTFEPSTATPIPLAEGRTPGPMEDEEGEEETVLRTATPSPFPFQTVASTSSGSVEVTPVASQLSRGSVAASVCTNWAVTGLGLALLVVGLILLRGR